jgi:hypothetical protein
MYNIGKKSYYLNGVLAEAPLFALKQGARHQQDSTVETYVQDAFTIKEVMKSRGTLTKGLIGTFRPIFCNQGHVASTKARRSLNITQSMSEIATEFCEKNCQLNKSSVINTRAKGKSGAFGESTSYRTTYG